MSTMRDHLIAFHKQSAVHCLELAKACQKMSDCMTKAAEGMKDGDEKDDRSESAAFYKSMADAHAAQGTYHADCAKALAEEPADKSASISRGEEDRIRPDGVAKIPLHPHPRPGAPTMQPTVALGFEKFVAVEEE